MSAALCWVGVTGEQLGFGEEKPQQRGKAGGRYKNKDEKLHKVERIKVIKVVTCLLRLN